MRTLTSLSAITAALAASVGLVGCGGSATSSAGGAGTGAGAGGASGGRPGTAGTTSSEGGATAGHATGGKATAGATTTGGTTTTGGAVTGGGATAGGASSWPCQNPMPVLDANGKPTGIERCETGGSHRTEPSECTVTLPRAEACQSVGAGGDSGFPSGCESDADCSAKPYGACFHNGQIGVCECSYGCRTDADCGKDALCICGGVVGNCQSATCHTDDDCVPGFQCRSFQDPTAFICGEQRFECQKPGDTCESDDSCAPEGYCLADANGEHHCVDFSCGTPGRPFLIDGCAVVAAVVERRDWLVEAAPVVGDQDLTPTARAALTAHYTRAAQLEHASIAAFARFTLQLLALGAPAQLVADSQRALGDELEHARSCFALATRFGQRALGPTGLSVAGCLEQAELAEVVRLAVREGCIGETVAAVLAAESHAHARDADVRRALFVIQRDETRHAELAFRFVRWALERDETVRELVLEELESAQRRSPKDDFSAAALDPQCVAHGLLPEAHLAMLEHRVVNQVVASLLRELTASTSARAA